MDGYLSIMESNLLASSFLFSDLFVIAVFKWAQYVIETH